MADRGFPVGGGGGGRGPVRGGVDLRRGCFSAKMCENERIGSRRGGVSPARPLDLPMLRTYPCQAACYTRDIQTTSVATLVYIVVYDTILTK